MKTIKKELNEVLKQLICLKHKNSNLEYRGTLNEKGLPINGFFICLKCQTKYFVKKGIIDFINKKNIASKLADSERKRRDEDAELYEYYISNYEDSTNTLPIAKAVNSKNKTILDLGCGVGYITLKYVDNADVVIACDFSEDSLNLFNKKIQETSLKNICLIRVDITKLPFNKNEMFDSVVIAGVLHHIPSKKDRELLIKSSNILLKNNGNLVVSVYNYILTKRIRKFLGMNEMREGMQNEDNVFYHCYDKTELAKLIYKYFNKVAVSGTFATIPIISNFLLNKVYKNNIKLKIKKPVMKIYNNRFYIIFDLLMRLIFKDYFCNRLLAVGIKSRSLEKR